MSERVAPLLVGPGNCEAVTGMPWRHVRDHAEKLGLTFVNVGNKRAIVASELLAALTPATTPMVEVDELAAMRARIARAG